MQIAIDWCWCISFERESLSSSELSIGFTIFAPWLIFTVEGVCGESQLIPRVPWMLLKMFSPYFDFNALRKSMKKISTRMKKAGKLRQYKKALRKSEWKSYFISPFFSTLSYGLFWAPEKLKSLHRRREKISSLRYLIYDLMKLSEL